LLFEQLNQEQILLSMTTAILSFRFFLNTFVGLGLLVFFIGIMYARYKMRPRCPACHRNSTKDGECRVCHQLIPSEEMALRAANRKAKVEPGVPQVHL